MWTRIPEGKSRLGLRRLLALYLAASGAALLFPHRSGPWLAVALLHAAGVAVLLDAGPTRSLTRKISHLWPRAAAILGDWYALILVPLLYAELPLLNRAVHQGHYFDETVLRWEAALFGGLPSQELAGALPALPLSEALHAFYLSYYLIIYLPPLYLWARRRFRDQQHLIFTLMLTFVAHYLFFVYFPVQGPRYLFPSPVEKPSQGPLFHLAQELLQAGSSRGAAFPSSHVGVVVAQTGMAFLVMRGAAPWLLVASAGLTVGAVYAGFHYATDALCGLVLGLLLFLAAPWVASWLGRGGEEVGAP